MSDGFYRAFEERFYASREVIKELRRQYLPFVIPLRDAHPGGRVLDLGCGRGEWLGLMDELGFDSFGVDLDEGMLESCFANGLRAAKGDAVEFLRTLPSSSHVLITGFHFVEHISFQELVVVIQEALRVLVPGGVLIMETPNPENIRVATCNFYLDPTHRRPLPSKLLAFLTEYHGFQRWKVLRLQEPEGMREKGSASLADVLCHVSPDYAVVAQAPGPEQELAVLDEALSGDYGCSLEELAQRFDQGLEGTVSELERRLRRAEMSVDLLVGRVSELKGQLATAEPSRLAMGSRLAEVSRELDAAQADRGVLRQQPEAAQEIASALRSERDTLTNRAEETDMMLQAVFTSTSWRITAPLRFINRSARWFVSGAWAWLTLKPGSRPRRIAKRIMRRGATAIEARPGLKQRIVWWAHRLGVYPALRRLYHRLTSRSEQAPQHGTRSGHALGGIATGDDLTPWTRHMSSRLEAARAAKKRGAK